VHIVCRDDGRAVNGVPKGIVVHRLGTTARGILARCDLGRQAMRRVLQIKPDFVHYHDPELHPWMTVLNNSGSRVVYDVRENHPFLVDHYNRLGHRSISKRGASLFRSYEKCILKRAFLVSVTRELSEVYRFIGRPITTVMNFAALKQFNPVELTREPVLLCGGTFNEDRGVLELIEVIGRLRRFVPGVRLILSGSFGENSFKRMVLARIEELNVRSEVVIADRIPHKEYIKHVLPQARIGLSINPPNGQNNVAFPVRLGEYWASGIPSIANDIPEVKAIHEKDQFFSMIRGMDMEALEAAAMHYLSSYDAAVEAGRLARKRFEEKYNGEAEFEKLAGFYESIEAGLLK